MATLKKETRWAVSKTYFTVREVDVLLDEEGKIVLYSEKNDEEYYEPGESTLFFCTNEEAEGAKMKLVPCNKEQVKNYLDSLFENANYDEMKEWLPLGVYRCFKSGCDNFFFRNHTEVDQIRDAIRGYINIKEYSFRPSEVVHVNWKVSGEAIVTLRDGKEIRTGERNDVFILRCMFGSN